MFHIRLEGNTAPILNNQFTHLEKDDVRECCGLMLLELAGSLMATAADTNPPTSYHGEWEEAKRLLDRAATLIQSPWIDKSRTRCERQLRSTESPPNAFSTAAVSLSQASESYLLGCDLSREGR